MQAGDIPTIFADTSALGNKPHTLLREGLRKFVEWYKEIIML